MKSPHYNRMTQKEISIQNQAEIKVLSDKLEKVDKGIDQILFYLNSDSKTNSEGFIEKSNRHDKEIKKVFELIGKIKFSASVISFIVGAAASTITFVILTWDKIKP